MAASLTAHVLSDPIVFQDWPHYKETREYYNDLLVTGIFHLFLFCKSLFVDSKQNSDKT